jgi:hypothetical protein
MEFKTLYDELTNSTEMLRALLAGISQYEARFPGLSANWSSSGGRGSKTSQNHTKLITLESGK